MPDLLERENSWFYCALASGFCGFALFIAGIIWTYAESSDPAEFSRRFDILYRGALVGAALVTFFTVVWRGLVSTRQVDAQTQQLTLIRRQLEHSETQSSLNERNELAKLLQKGAELMDGELQAHRSAGMATLEFVALQDRDFAQQALNLLGEKYERDAIAEDRARETRRLQNFVEKMFREKGRRAEISIEFNAGDKERSWELAKGFSYVSYRGGNVWGVVGNNIVEKDDRYHFQDVDFTAMDIDVDTRFFRCTFNECTIYALKGFSANSNEFFDCDFSGCVLEFRFEKPFRLKGRGNTYDPLNPPRLNNGDTVALEWLASNLTVKSQ